MAMSVPKLLCLSGSLRAAASSTATIETAIEQLGGRASCRRFDIGALPHYNADLSPAPEIVEQFKAAIAEADGLLIVTPEYNFSVTGVLKNAIDWASRPAYQSVFKGKPVFVASVSGGALGGVRAQAHLKYILNGMLADVFTWQEVVITQANTKVANGRLTDDATITFLMAGVDAFVDGLK